MSGYIQDSGIQSSVSGIATMVLPSTVAGRDIVVALIQNTSAGRTYTCADDINGSYGSPVVYLNPARAVGVFRFKNGVGGTATIQVQNSSSPVAFIAIAFEVDGLDQTASPLSDTFIDAGNVNSHPCASVGNLDTTTGFFGVTATWLTATTGSPSTAATGWTLIQIGSQHAFQHIDSAIAVTDERGTWSHPGTPRTGTSCMALFPYAVVTGVTGAAAVDAPAATGAAAGASVVAGSGAPSAPSATDSASGSPVVAGVGAPSAPAATGAASGKTSVTGTGAAQAPAATDAASGAPIVAGQGAVQAPAAVAAGADTVPALPLITGQVLGTIISVGNRRGMRCVTTAAITLTHGGVWVLGPPGQWASTVPVEVYDASQALLATAVVSLTGPTGEYAYAAFDVPVSLPAGATFYLMVATGYNAIYGASTQVTPDAVITVVAASEGTPGTFYEYEGIANRSFGPLNAYYTLTPAGTTGTADVVAPAATDAASGAPVVGGQGAAQAPAATDSAAGTPVVAGAAAPTAPTAGVSASGKTDVVGQGAPSAPAAGAAASGAPVITGAAAPSAPAATGVGSDGGGVSGSGAVQAPASTGAAAGAPVVGGQVAAQAPAATDSASGAPVVAGAAAPSAPAADVAGAGTVPVVGTGSVQAPAATDSAAGAPVVTGAAAPVAPAADAVGEQNLGSVTGAADVSAPAATGAAAGTPAVAGAAAPSAPAADATGAGKTSVTGTGAAQAPDAETSGSGAPAVTGAASVQAPAATVVGQAQYSQPRARLNSLARDTLVPAVRVPMVADARGSLAATVRDAVVAPVRDAMDTPGP